ncbi:hypothetical protein EYF80_037850 [Liparis tanakae]|uniref:Uncharacterized protein n=1 Tax=Liparis tanakae TaxID=230148 RepID=A0A4Z2GGC1_9TELE|nr:hypothetical protein EYF80_037850 [Liparis tanakae]
MPEALWSAAVEQRRVTPVLCKTEGQLHSHRASYRDASCCDNKDKRMPFGWDRAVRLRLGGNYRLMSSISEHATETKMADYRH